MSPIIQMEEVSWRRNGKDLLSGINWRVEEGEHWTILGLNGSGKTSLLKMVNGYIWPTTGQVSVLGRKFGQTDMHQLRKKIGWVSAAISERVNERHPTEELVISGRYAAVGLDYVQPLEEDYERAKEWMQQLGIGHTYGQRYGKCSNGEKQKVLIARALMANPSLLILDEPSNGLDFQAREALLEKVQDLMADKAGPSILYVTHHMEEVLPNFTHCLLMKDGKIFQQGEREQVMTNENLSQLFQRPLEVEWKQGRPWMYIKD